MSFTSKYSFKLLHSTFFILFSSLCLSQDLIIKKDNNKIYCKIISEDCIIIRYHPIKEVNSTNNSIIAKEEVKEYYYGTTPAEQKKLENDIKAARKKDSLLSEKNKILHVTFFYSKAFPYGKFSNKDLSGNSGYAKKGYNTGLSIIFKLSKYTGLSASYIYQHHNYNNAAFDKYLESNYSGWKFNVTTSPWKTQGILGGLYFTIPIATYNNLYFETNISGGFLKYTSPEQEIYAQLETYIWELDKQHASKTNAFTIVFNAGLRYKLQKHICLSLSIDFLIPNPNLRMWNMNRLSLIIAYHKKTLGQIISNKKLTPTILKQALFLQLIVVIKEIVIEIS